MLAPLFAFPNGLLMRMLIVPAVAVVDAASTTRPYINELVAWTMTRYVLSTEPACMQFPPAEEVAFTVILVIEQTPNCMLLSAVLAVPTVNAPICVEEAVEMKPPWSVWRLVVVAEFKVARPVVVKAPVVISVVMVVAADTVAITASVATAVGTPKRTTRAKNFLKFMIHDTKLLNRLIIHLI